MQDVKRFIAMRRYETTTLHALMQDLRVSECEWLLPPSAANAEQRNVPPSDSLKRLELLQEFVYWYFDSFLIPLLKVSCHQLAVPAHAHVIHAISRPTFTSPSPKHIETRSSISDRTTGRCSVAPLSNDCAMTRSRRCQRCCSI